MRAIVNGFIYVFFAGSVLATVLFAASQPDALTFVETGVADAKLILGFEGTDESNQYAHMSFDTIASTGLRIRSHMVNIGPELTPQQRNQLRACFILALNRAKVLEGLPTPTPTVTP